MSAARPEEIGKVLDSFPSFSEVLRLSRYGTVDRVMGWACAVDCVSDYPYNYAGILTVNTLIQSLITTKYVLRLTTFIHTSKYEIIQQTIITPKHTHFVLNPQLNAPSYLC